MAALRTKAVHRAKHIREDGSVSALCFRTPRAIDLSRAGWTNRWEAVTCPRCLAARVVLPGDKAQSADPAERWRALEPSTQWSYLFDLTVNVKIREYKIAHWKDHEMDKDKARTEIARDRALLILLQSVTDEALFADAKKIGERP